MRLRCVSFNVLADAYIGYGDYSHVEPGLLERGARLLYLEQLIDKLDAHIIGLQEADLSLLDVLLETGKWHIFWSPKTGRTDGCLALVRRGYGIKVAKFWDFAYGAGDGAVAQCLLVNDTVFINTHLQWAPPDSLAHVGVRQATELLEKVGEGPSVIFADCNDRPGGPVRYLIEDAGFTNVCGERPTALIGSERAPIDLLSVRGVQAAFVDFGFYPEGIPSRDCPSDHIPVCGDIELD